MTDAPVQRPAEGWRLVPETPDETMLGVASRECSPRDNWRAMLEVAPEPPVENYANVAAYLDEAETAWRAARDDSGYSKAASWAMEYGRKLIFGWRYTAARYNAAAPVPPPADEGMVEAMARAHNKAWREFRKWDGVEAWPAYCDAKDVAAMRAALALYLPPASLSPAGQAEPAGWRPIETAPESGSFLVWCPEYHNIYVVYCNRWTELEWPFAHFGPGADLLRESATHWHTLPSPPSEPGQ